MTLEAQAYDRYLRMGTLWPQLRTPLVAAVCPELCLPGGATGGGTLGLDGVQLVRAATGRAATGGGALELDGEQLVRAATGRAATGGGALELDGEQLVRAANRATLLHRKFGLGGPDITVEDMVRDWNKTVNATAFLLAVSAGTARGETFATDVDYAQRWAPHSRIDPALYRAATATVRALIAETRAASAYRRTLRPVQSSGVRDDRRGILRALAQRLDHVVVGVEPEVRAVLALGCDRF